MTGSTRWNKIVTTTAFAAFLLMTPLAGQALADEGGPGGHVTGSAGTAGDDWPWEIATDDDWPWEGRVS